MHDIVCMVEVEAGAGAETVRETWRRKRVTVANTRHVRREARQESTAETNAAEAKEAKVEVGEEEE